MSTVAHVCKEKLKGPPAVLFYKLGAGGAGTRTASWGAPEDPSQRSFNARFGRSTSDPMRGRGDKRTSTPYPQAAITIETSITRAPS